MLATFKRLAPERQENILDAASRVFAKDGYDKANVADICLEAGISMGALYKYFKNKEAVLMAVLDHGLHLMVQELFGRYTRDSGSLFEAVEGLFRGVGSFTRRYRSYVEIWVNMSSCSMNRFASIVSPKVESAAREFYFELLEKAKERGEIARDLRSDLAAQFLDNHLCLYTYSLVSEYHRRRFDAYFPQGQKQLSQRQKVELILESARAFLAVRMPGVAPGREGVEKDLPRRAEGNR
ncbi:MAG: TetR/AcrR family transcriptional regulator [bacterium]